MALPTYHPGTWWSLADDRAHRIVVRLDGSGITGCHQGVPLVALRPYTDGDERCIGCFLHAEDET